MELITGSPVKVLTPEMVCVDVKSTKVAGLGISETKANVPVTVGRVNVPVFVMDVITGAPVKVLTPEMVWVDVKSIKLAGLGISETNANAPETVGKVNVPSL